MMSFVLFHIGCLLAYVVVTRSCKIEQLHTAFGNSETEVTVAWAIKGNLTNTSEQNVKYRSENENTSKTWKTLNAIGVQVGSYSKYHAKITDLIQDTRYEISIGGENEQRLNTTYRTPRNDTDWSPRIALFGDLGYTNDQLLKFLPDESVSGAIDAIVLYGDMVYWANGENENSFMRDVAQLSANVPLQVTPGNGDSGGNFSIYRSDFHMPDGANSDSLWHAFSIGPMRVIGISTEVFYYQSKLTQQNMLMWLEKELQDANLVKNRIARPWIVVHYHRPAYSENYGDSIGDTYARSIFEPMMYKYGVDIVFAGHVHNQARTLPVFNGTVMAGHSTDPYADSRAPVNVVSGNPSNAESTSYFSSPPERWTAWRSYAFGYAHATAVNRTALHVDIVSTQLAGRVVDEFWITKSRTCNFGSSCAGAEFPASSLYRGVFPRPEATKVYATWRERSASTTSPTGSQIASLQEMYAFLDGPNWTRASGWTNVGCKWTYGISCANVVDALMPPSSIEGVTAIQLPFNNLKGRLEVVNFLPFERSLQLLDLSDNLLYGTFPESIFALRSLHTILLDSLSFAFQISGELPNDLVSTNRMPHLKTLSMQRQNISGNVPSSFGSLQCSETHYANVMPACIVWLSQNRLSGQISLDLCNATFGEFYAANNSFSCPLPCLSVAYKTFGDACSGVECKAC